MKLFFQIMTSLALAYWPILVLTSVMIFDSPGSTDNRKAIYIALAVTFLPMMLGLLYLVFNQTFWGIKPKTFFILTIVIPIIASLVMGYPKLLLNSFKGVSSNGYFVKDNKVYYRGTLIPAKAEQLEVLDQFSLYARNSEYAFYQGRQIEGANPKTFKSVGESSTYYFDDRNVFFNGKLLKGSDASTFKMLERGTEMTLFFKDKNAVYWEGLAIEGLNPEQVRVVSSVFLADQNSVFYFNKKIAGADPKTFEIIPKKEAWARDQKSLYYEDQAYPEVDVSTVQLLERGYLKDKSKVYHHDGKVLKIVAGVNPENFRVTNWDDKTKSEATDGKNYFLEGNIVSQ